MHDIKILTPSIYCCPCILTQHSVSEYCSCILTHTEHKGSPSAALVIWHTHCIRTTHARTHTHTHSLPVILPFSLSLSVTALRMTSKWKSRSYSDTHTRFLCLSACVCLSLSCSLTQTRTPHHAWHQSRNRWSSYRPLLQNIVSFIGLFCKRDTPHHAWHQSGNRRSNYRSLLQNIVSFIGLFCKRDTPRHAWYQSGNRPRIQTHPIWSTCRDHASSPSATPPSSWAH